MRRIGRASLLAGALPLFALLAGALPLFALLVACADDSDAVSSLDVAVELVESRDVV